MPGQIRTDKKLMKVFYKIMKVPKNQQQGTRQKPSEKKQEMWDRDNISSQ